MKKKVCILSNGLWRGGTDTFVVNLVKGLDKNKYDITVVLSISDEWLAEREPEVIAAGAKTVTDEVKRNGEKMNREKLYNVMIKYIAPVMLVIILITYSMAQFGFFTM